MTDDRWLVYTWFLYNNYEMNEYPAESYLVLLLKWRCLLGVLGLHGDTRGRVSIYSLDSLI